MAKEKEEKCNNCLEEPRSFGVFCQKCLKAMKEDKKREKENDAKWLAAECGAGDFWRFNY